MDKSGKDNQPFFLCNFRAKERGLPPPGSIAAYTDVEAADQLARSELSLFADGDRGDAEDEEGEDGMPRSAGLGLHRNKALVGLVSMYDSPDQQYVDALRGYDPAMDIKQAMKQKW